MQLDMNLETWMLKEPCTITGYTMDRVQVLVVTLTEGGYSGRSEAAGVYYHQDLPPQMAVQIERIRPEIEAGINRERLQTMLPPCGARNALDCALWELEAKQTGRPIWELAGLGTPKRLLTTYTLGADHPEKMAAGASAFADARAIKLKLTGEAMDAERVRAVRIARPDVWLAIDANQGFTRESLEGLMPCLLETDVQLIEQPFPIGRDADLDGLNSPIKIAADESVQSLADIPGLVGRFQVMNIKLDKCGGLSEALLMAAEGRRRGLEIMVGNMGGTSLAMAPAFMVGQICDIADIDGPLILAKDRSPPVVYDKGRVWCPEEIWGRHSSFDPVGS